MADLPHNPFKMLRHAQGISQYELARRLGLSKHAILRNEQGCYDNPLPSVVAYYADNHFKGVPYLSRPELLDAYSEFQYHTRQSNALLFGDSLVYSLLGLEGELQGFPGTPVGVHPFAYLRSVYGLNPTEVSKKLCVAQNIIVYWEKRSLAQKTVPQQIIRALHDAEYTEEDTDALVTAYEKYRQWLRADKGLSLVKEDTSDRTATAV